MLIDVVLMSDGHQHVSFMPYSFLTTPCSTTHGSTRLELKLDAKCRMNGYTEVHIDVPKFGVQGR
jgi:hypothetical protein